VKKVALSQPERKENWRQVWINESDPYARMIGKKGLDWKDGNRKEEEAAINRSIGAEECQEKWPDSGTTLLQAHLSTLGVSTAPPSYQHPEMLLVRQANSQRLETHEC
jgi:hypothetical protein